MSTEHQAKASTPREVLNWRPEEKVENNPLFSWPIHFKGLLAWYFNAWKPNSEYAIFLLMSLLTWFFFQVPLREIQLSTWPSWEFANWHWVTQIYLRNLFYTLLFAGGFHLYFYTYVQQRDVYKYEKRALSPDSSRFTFGKQVYDNMFWSLVSGVSIWTAYETFCLYAISSGWTPLYELNDGAIWFCALFLLIPLWISLHFYLGHRLLHWPPLYKISHAVHHRNINTGPWTGISMHPIEHIIYFSSVLIHLFVPSHPIHIFFHLYSLSISAIFGHVGYDALVIGGKVRIAIGHFHHQLHHRYFECNYGAVEVPCDVWAGTFDDGSAEARKRLREKTRERFLKNNS